MPIIPQPRTVNNNKVRILWTDEQTEYLIDQRMSRNDEYWGLSKADQRDFWENVASEINECFGTTFTHIQVKIKWKNLVKEHVVSIFYVEKIYCYILIINEF
jgi:hypothetical protein